MIPLAIPNLGEREMELVRDCIEQGWVSSVGPRVGEFERGMAGFLGARDAIACSSGTAAIHLALLAAGVDAGSEVIVPSLTFIASVNPIRYCGAEPVFVDVDPSTLTISAPALEDLLRSRYQRRGDGFVSSDGRRLAAVLTVDLYGHPADHEAVAKVVAPYGVPIVEDAAEALGAFSHGRPAGRLGLVSALSFNGNKVITTGGGGMVITDDAAIGERVRHLSTQARVPGLEYAHDDVGYNYRLTNLQAALGVAQLEQLPAFVEHKRAIAERYSELLAGVAGVTVIGERPWARSSFWLTSALIESVAADRSELHRVVRELAAAGVEARPFFTPAHLLPHYGGGAVSLPETERVFARGLNLPSSTGMDLEDVDRVVDALVAAAGLERAPA